MRLVRALCQMSHQHRPAVLLPELKFRLVLLLKNVCLATRRNNGYCRQFEQPASSRQGDSLSSANRHFYCNTMRHIISSLLLALSLVLSPPVVARGGHSSTPHTSISHSAGTHTASSRSAVHTSHKNPTVASSKVANFKTTNHKSNYAQGVQRDSHGKIARSQHAKSDFKKQHPCPSTGKSSGACPGYVIDHVKSLKRGGADQPSNMQWQTKQAAKEKDKTE